MYIISSSKGQWCGHQRLRPTRALFSFGPGSTSKRKRSCLRVPRYEYLGKYSFWSMLRHFFQQQTNTRWLCWEWLTCDRLVLYVNLKQNEAQSARAESTNKGVNLEFMYLVFTLFTRMPGESYRRRLRSLLYLCYVFRAN